MKAPLIQIKNLHISISTFTKADSDDLLSGRAAFYEEALKTGVMPVIEPPAIGEYWAGQGGIYGGRREYPEGLCYVIFAATDVGKHAYGEPGAEVNATSNIDGRENTAILVDRDGSHPAAEAAYAYTCDGHNDFYLPSSGELHHGYLYLPESFEKDWYISSTQRSADNAYYVAFEDGWLDSNVKFGERLARPVRRILC